MSSVTEILVVGCIGENVGFENVYEIWGFFGRGCALLLALYSFRVGVSCCNSVDPYCGGCRAVVLSLLLTVFVCLYRKSLA